MIMSKLKLILVRLCLVMGSIFIGANMYSNAFAGQVATASFDMEANGIAYRIFTAALPKPRRRAAIRSST